MLRRNEEKAMSLLQMMPLSSDDYRRTCKV
jgi:hypothetical protein